MADYTMSDLQHGKAECRLVQVGRTSGATDGATAGATDGARHVLHDLNVTTQLRGDFATAYTDGDNAHVHATDTQKNSVFALAREHGVTSPEAFLGVLADHWAAQPWVTGTWFAAEQYSWERLPANGHSFVRAGQETRTAWVQTYGDDRFVLAGLRDLVVLKSTGSEFHGFPRDRFTTLAETDDRVLATSVSATWRYADEVDYGATYGDVRAALLDAFAGTHSLALQQTIHAMATAALDACPAIAEIRIACPNKHHFLVDLEPFGLDNPGADRAVYHAADRPYGLISATVSRTGADDEPRAWAGIG